jgi:hypothetical protein
MDRSVEDTVQTLLAVAGISPDNDEVSELTRVYPMFRTALDGLHSVREARDASPALVFGATGPYVDWYDQDRSATAAMPLGSEESER